MLRSFLRIADPLPYISSKTDYADCNCIRCNCKKAIKHCAAFLLQRNKCWTAIILSHLNKSFMQHCMLAYRFPLWKKFVCWQTRHYALIEILIRFMFFLRMQLKNNFRVWLSEKIGISCKTLWASAKQSERRSKLCQQS